MHGEQAVEPGTAANVPTLHVVHTDPVVAPTAALNLPVTQTAQAELLTWGSNLPAGQDVHSAAPALINENLPAEQLTQADSAPPGAGLK